MAKFDTVIVGSGFGGAIMACRKIVRDDPGFDMLSDTTTLHTLLYRGQDSSGEVVGAGGTLLGRRADG